MRHRLLHVLAVLAALLLLAAAPAAAATAANDEGGVLVRVGGDTTVSAEDDADVVVVVGGDLDLTGQADTVVVVDGTARLDEATIDELVVVSGTAILGPGTTVSGDVQLVDSTIQQDPTATVEGDINNDANFPWAEGVWLMSLILVAGWAVLVILAGLALAAVAPGLARGVGRTITTDLGKSALAGLVLWLAVPIVALLAFGTVIGIPVAVTVLLMVLPAMAFAGLVVGAVRLGELLVSRGEGVGHPYLAATVGTTLLVVVGLVPFFGTIVLAVVSFLGSGALALHALRAVRSDGPGVDLDLGEPVPIPGATA